MATGQPTDRSVVEGWAAQGSCEFGQVGRLWKALVAMPGRRPNAVFCKGGPGGVASIGAVARDGNTPGTARIEPLEHATAGRWASHCPSGSCRIELWNAGMRRHCTWPARQSRLALAG